LIPWSGFGGSESEFVALAAKVRDDFNAKRDLAALDGLADTVDEACGRIRGRRRAGAGLARAAEIARGKAQPAAGFPFFRVETGERDFVEPGEIFGKRGVDAPGDEGRRLAGIWFRGIVFRNGRRFLASSGKSAS
jgi:hypothetical protein